MVLQQNWVTESILPLQALIIAQVGEKQQCSSGTCQTMRLVGLTFIVYTGVLYSSVVKIKADHISQFPLMGRKLRPDAYCRSCNTAENAVKCKNKSKSVSEL